MKNTRFMHIITICSALFTFYPKQLYAYAAKLDHTEVSDPISELTMICAGLVGILIRLIIKKEFYNKHQLFVHVLALSILAGIFIITNKEFAFSTGRKICICIIGTITSSACIAKFYED